MVEIPLTIRCDCGTTHSVTLGGTVTCGCGREYDTSELDQARLMGVRHAQAKIRLYITFGLVLIVGIAATAYFAWGIRGVAVGLPVGALVWFRLIGPRVRKRVFYGAGELPSWQLRAKKPDGS